jgi:hypothetical protein
MTDIAKAIEKEREYISFRMKNEEPFHLIDAVRECGFESLEDYFAAKQRYQLGKMNIVKFKSREAVDTIKRFIANQEQAVAYCVHDENSVLVSGTSEIDRDFCEETGYKVFETQHSGGAVVVNEGDVSVILFGEIGNSIMLDFASYLIDRYREKGLNAVLEGNDVLVDGYKISGLSATPYGSIQYSTIHIGVNTNLDHIKAICKKPMVKVPRGLSEWGVTTEEVEQMFLDFCETEKN